MQDIAGNSRTIPAEVDESSLLNSSNAVIPGDVVRPGLEMVIEVDPDGTLDPELGVTARIPETGRLAIEVGAMPLFDLTLVPFVREEDPDLEIVGTARSMAADPENHELLWETRTLLRGTADGCPVDSGASPVGRGRCGRRALSGTGLRG